MKNTRPLGASCIDHPVGSTASAAAGLLLDESFSLDVDERVDDRSSPVSLLLLVAVVDARRVPPPLSASSSPLAGGWAAEAPAPPLRLPRTLLSLPIDERLEERRLLSLRCCSIRFCAAWSPSCGKTYGKR